MIPVPEILDMIEAWHKAELEEPDQHGLLAKIERAICHLRDAPKDTANENPPHRSVVRVIEVYPVKIEAVDADTKDIVFTLETFDEYSATLDVRSVVNLAFWDELSASIREGIIMLKLRV